MGTNAKKTSTRSNRYFTDLYALLHLPRSAASADVLARIELLNELNAPLLKSADRRFRQAAKRRGRHLWRATNTFWWPEARARYDARLESFQGPISQDGEPPRRTEGPRYDLHRLLVCTPDEARTHAQTKAESAYPPLLDGPDFETLRESARAENATVAVCQEFVKACSHYSSMAIVYEGQLWLHLGVIGRDINRYPPYTDPRTYAIRVRRDLAVVRRIAKREAVRDMLRMQTQFLDPKNDEEMKRQAANMTVQRLYTTWLRIMRRFDDLAGAIQIAAPLTVRDATNFVDACDLLKAAEQRAAQAAPPPQQDAPQP